MSSQKKSRCVRKIIYPADAMKAATRMTEKEISIKAPWGKIAGLTWGNPSNPPVLLCHGKLDGCSSFRPLVTHLPDSYFYVTIDLPGNGRSDHLPKGVLFTVIDLVPTVVRVMKHFEWKKFVYIGWSLGVYVGKFFNIAYPGHITRMVEIDPVPAHHTWPTTREALKDWYHYYYSYYEDKKYGKSNAGPETAPKYTYKKAQELLMKTRGMTKEASEHVLERVLAPTEDGLYRFTLDQRMKGVPVLPFSGELLSRIYTTTETPTFGIIASQMIDEGCYENSPFVTDPNLWPNKNYSCKIVKGGHDVHINEPECMAEDIGRFLMEDIKAKI